MFKISEGEAEHIRETSPPQTLTRYVSLVTTYNKLLDLYYTCKQQASYNAQFKVNQKSLTKKT